VLAQTPRPALAAGPALATAPVGAQQVPSQTASDTTARVYQDNRPSVVTVISSVVQPGFRSEPQWPGAGSGFVIDNQGHI
jgi:S1-C subfamily serine protease